MLTVKKLRLLWHCRRPSVDNSSSSYIKAISLNVKASFTTLNVLYSWFFMSFPPDLFVKYSVLDFLCRICSQSMDTPSVKEQADVCYWERKAWQEWDEKALLWDCLGLHLKKSCSKTFAIVLCLPCLHEGKRISTQWAINVNCCQANTLIWF